MPEHKITIWSNNYFSPEQTKERELLENSVGNNRLVLFEPKDNGASGEARDVLLSAEVVFGQPDVKTLLQSENLRWLHVNSAGYAAYDSPEVKEFFRRREPLMTNSSAVYDEPCAQHLLAMILSSLRGLPYALNAQFGEKSWQMQALRPRLHLPAGQTAVIYGFGSIATRLVELLTPLRMNLIGVRREPRGDEPIKIVGDSEADEYLPLADHIINILPENQSTKNYFSRERLTAVKPTAVFYNIGRGTTVDQAALIENLKTEKLAAAYLDVTEPEPLPPEHELWVTPNCFITPHVAGGTSDEKRRQINHFLENLRRFEAGEELINRII